MGVYIEGLNRPRNEYMRIHIDFDGEVWVFRGSGWKSLGIKATDLDLVRCKDCKYMTEHYDTDGNAPYWTCSEWDSGTDYDGFCSYGERRTDE